MKIIFILLTFIFGSAVAQTQLLNEKIEKNKLSFEFKCDLNYSLMKRNNKSTFIVSNYQNVGDPGNVKLPSYRVFISLPFFKKPKIKYSILQAKKIFAIPEFNGRVELKDEKLVYSKSKTLKNTKDKHFRIKGYFWSGNEYCLSLEITPAVFVSSKNLIELVNKFEIELLFDQNIPQQKSLNNQKNKNNIVVNTAFHLNSKVRKYLLTTDDSWIDYSKKYIKIGTAEDGIYRITRTNLANLGINVSTINPKSFMLISRGREIPIFIKGENDLSFDSDDYIEFVGIKNIGGHHREISTQGEPYNEYLGRYTDTTVYWLTWNGLNGKRVSVSSGNESVSNDTLNYYSQINHYEKNNWFDFAYPSLVDKEMPYWNENQTWFEGTLRVGIKNKRFNVSDFVKNSSFSMFVKLQDKASDISLKAHQISLGLNTNNKWSDSVYVNKYETVVLNSVLTTNLLNNGSNTLKIESIPTEASLNACRLDWYEIEYPRYLYPVDDSLKFLFPFVQNTSVKTIKIQNVNTNNFVVWKYGNKYKKYNLAKVGTEVFFSDTISNNDKFLYLSEAKVKSPKIYYLKQFTNLRSTNNQADYIAITHKKFIDKVYDYTQFIASTYNVKTKVIDIEDIYDEFGYGFFNPEAIKDFLKATFNNWKNPKPVYIALIGGATYDYYGYKHKNFGIDRVKNYVPSFGAPVSDNWFVTWDTTGAFIPQMNIGRIPVTTNEELEWYFEKHKNYVSQKYNDWNKKYLFFSGGDEKQPNQLNSLKQANQYVIDNYVLPSPIGGKAEHFYKTIDPLTNFGPYSKEYIQNAIDDGGVFISYLGHSGTQTWDNSIISPKQLMNNNNRYPIVSDFGCSTGKFAEPDVTSFSELFTLSPEGQALAYIGNSSLGFLSTSLLMPKLFYKKILKENIHTVSEAHKQAKIEMLKTNGTSGVYQLSALTNTYFGDPILALPIPNKTNFVIKENAFKIESKLVTDLTDSVGISIKFYNYGSVLDDSLDILLLHQFNNNTDTLFIVNKIPKFSDSIFVKIKTLAESGKHTLRVILDPQNKYEEIFENDNTAQFSFNVFSSSIRPLFTSQILNGVKDQIKLINPSSKPKQEIIDLELADDKFFTNKKVYEIKFDSVLTSFKLSNLNKNKRYWGKTKIKGENNYSAVFSFYDNGEKYYLTDSLGFNIIKHENISLKNNNFKIDTSKIKFTVISAGFSDGNTVLIQKNSVNHVFDGTLRGHYVSIFRDSTYEFVDSKVFDLLGGGSTVAEAYDAFLDTLSDKYIAVFSIKDEGAINLSESLKEKIKTFGSVFIDSVDFRASWALIGKKGAIPGTMPEAFSHEGDGYVTIDTTISFLSEKGSMLSTEIGPATNWKKLVVDQELPSNSKITYFPIGITKSGTLDTLAQLTITDSVADLRNISSVSYPKIKILAKFNSSEDKHSPILHSLGVDYDMPPELAINYQVVSIKQDSVEQGNNVELAFYVYNVGESTARNFKVQVDVIKPDNSKEKIFEQVVDSLGVEKRKHFDVSYNTTSFNGRRTFSISIDTENKIQELYEDNNYFTIPFFVKGDTTKPSLNITFNGNDIFDGEYISNKPNVKIELNEPSLVPITDTNSVTLFLNNKLIPYKNNDEVLSINYSQTNPKVVVNYTPTLDDGEYKLKVFGKDASGNVADSSGISKSFVVQSKPKILDVYNYPNPMTNDTYFTFKLTQVPDEIRIRIFTIAGRMIKELKLNNSELHYDLNKIYWDGRDTDGDQIANGTYLYKIIMDMGGKKQTVTKKLAIVK